MWFDPGQTRSTSLSEFGVSVRRGALIGLAVVAIAAPFYWQHRTANEPPAQGRAHAAGRTAVAVASTPPVAIGVPEFNGARVSPDVRRLTAWIARSHDNGPHGFVVVDKKLARVYVFDAASRLRGTSPVLLGATRGDDAVPGIGLRPMAQVRLAERTTPAGRFVAEPGRNASGEDVVWVDYDDAVSMHRVRTTNPREHRLERLATETIADNRISYGCINLPVAFYESQVRPVFAAQRAVVYVMPDLKPLSQVFPALAEPHDGLDGSTAGLAAALAAPPRVASRGVAHASSSYAVRPSAPTASVH